MATLVQGVDLAGTASCAAFNLRKTARVVTQQYDEALRKAGLRSTQFTILIAIAKSPHASVRSLAELTLMDATTMTRNLRLLAADGLVEVPARGTRREKRVRLTKTGERALARATPLWRAAQARFVSAFGERRWSQMRRELDQVATLVHQDQQSV